MKKRMEIPAIHDKDLLLILKELDLLDEINDKKIKCSNCDEVITIENIGALKKENNQISLICDNPEYIANQSFKTQ